jgi:hypothetical protein
LAAARRTDVNPQQRDDDGEEAGPDEDNGGSLAASAHETLEEGVQMHEHPETEEHSAQKLAPLGVGGVDRAGDAHGYGDHVGDPNSDGRNKQRRPLHNVQICINVVFVLTRRLRRQSEGDFHSSHNLEQTLEDSSKMRTRSSNHPKLLVPPPLLQRNLRPSHLQNGERAQRHGDGEQVDQKRQVQILHDELATEERKRGDEAVNQQENGRERVNADVQIRHTLQEFQPRAREKRIVPGEENLNGSSRPTKHLQSQNQNENPQHSSSCPPNPNPTTFGVLLT